MHTPPVRPCLLIAALAATCLAGCSGYQLRGLVVDGYDPAIGIDRPAVLIVAPDDPRLTRPGIPGATLALTLDPDTMRPISAGTTATDSRGRFSLPVGHGAGLLMYSARIVIRRDGHQTAQTHMPLPPAGRRLLIILPPGTDTFKPATDFVDETLEMSRPYLEGHR